MRFLLSKKIALAYKKLICLLIVAPIFTFASNVKNNLFFESDLFLKKSEGLNPQQKFQCISSCLYLIGLSKSPAEEKLIHQMIGEIDFTKPHQNLIPALAIQFVEKLKGMSFDASPTNATEIALDVAERMTSLWFHGTNFHALKGITERGLIRGDRYGNFDEKEIIEIDRIGRKFLPLSSDSSGLFPAYLRQDETRQITGRYIYLAGEPREAINYAIRSPNWFKRYVNAFLIDHQSNEPILKRIETSLIKLQDLPEKELQNGKKNITREEAKKINDFTKKYWETYIHPRSVVLVIQSPRLALYVDESQKTQNLQAYLISKIEKNNESPQPRDLRQALTALFDIQEKHSDRALKNQDIPPEAITAFVIPLANEMN